MPASSVAVPAATSPTPPITSESATVVVIVALGVVVFAPLFVLVAPMPDVSTPETRITSITICAAAVGVSVTLVTGDGFRQYQTSVRFVLWNVERARVYVLPAESVSVPVMFCVLFVLIVRTTTSASPASELIDALRDADAPAVAAA